MGEIQEIVRRTWNLKNTKPNTMRWDIETKSISDSWYNYYEHPFRSQGDPFTDKGESSGRYRDKNCSLNDDANIAALSSLSKHNANAIILTNFRSINCATTVFWVSLSQYLSYFTNVAKYGTSLLLITEKSPHGQLKLSWFLRHTTQPIPFTFLTDKQQRIKYKGNIDKTYRYYELMMAPLFIFPSPLENWKHIISDGIYRLKLKLLRPCNIFSKFSLKTFSICNWYKYFFLFKTKLNFKKLNSIRIK